MALDSQKEYGTFEARQRFIIFSDAPLCIVLDTITFIQRAGSVSSRDITEFLPQQ
jgi:hypothetical protein